MVERKVDGAILILPSDVVGLESVILYVPHLNIPAVFQSRDDKLLFPSDDFRSSEVAYSYYLEATEREFQYYLRKHDGDFVEALKEVLVREGVGEAKVAAMANIMAGALASALSAMKELLGDAWIKAWRVKCTAFKGLLSAPLIVDEWLVFEVIGCVKGGSLEEVKQLRERVVERLGRDCEDHVIAVYYDGEGHVIFRALCCPY